MASSASGAAAKKIPAGYGGFCWFASQLGLRCCANPCKTDREQERKGAGEGAGDCPPKAEAEGEALPPWVGISCITRTSLISIALVPACGGRGEDRPCEGGRAGGPGRKLCVAVVGWITMQF